jgi:hypothetical protein
MTGLEINRALDVHAIPLAALRDRHWGYLSARSAGDVPPSRPLGPGIRRNEVKENYMAGRGHGSF